MKVAVIIDTWFPFIGGGQINAWEISKRLVQKGIAIDIITRNNGTDNLKPPKNLKIIKLGAKSKPNNLFSQLFFCVSTFSFIYKRNYDLVHAHAFLTGITAWVLKIFKNLPVIFTVHGTSINTNLNNSLWEFIEKLILTKILYSAQTSVSRDFLKIENVNKKVIYIPNGIDVSRFDKVKTQKFKNPTLIFVGRLHRQKNLPILLQTVKLLIKEMPNLRLLIVGNGPEKQKIAQIIKNLRLGRFVKMMGEITGTSLIKLYKSCHLFILPSIYEGQPLTLLEAWAAKLPVVVTRTGDCQYLVKNGYNGYLIANPQSPSEIAKRIKVALGSQNLEKLGQAGYNLTKSFPWDSSAQKTLELYNNVINSKN